MSIILQVVRENINHQATARMQAPITTDSPVLGKNRCKSEWKYFLEDRKNIFLKFRIDLVFDGFCFYWSIEAVIRGNLTVTITDFLSRIKYNLADLEIISGKETIPIERAGVCSDCPMSSSPQGGRAVGC